jgi:hypothetical protein
MSEFRVRLGSVLALLTAGVVLTLPGCGDDDAASNSSGGHGGGSGAQGGAAGAPVNSEAGSGTAGQQGDGGAAGGADGGTAGSGGEAGPGPSTDPELPPYVPAGDDVQGYLNELSGWVQPPPDSEMTSELDPENRSLAVDGNAQDFKCTRVEHDIVANHDEILNFDIGSQYVMPGLILQGTPFQEGELAPIPFARGKRAPIKLYVNVAGTEDASEVAYPPTTAGLTSAVSRLQERAKEAAGDNFAAKVTYSHSEVQSMEQLMWSLGLDFNYDGAVVDVGFQAAFSNQEKTDKHTVVMKLQQDMYTVSFAYDELMRGADFFTDQLTKKDLQQLERDGYISEDNQPVFISSVTYGRMVVFTATSTRSESASAISQALQLSYDSFVGGSTSLDENAKAETKATLSNLEIKVLALGGNSDTVSGAIQAGDWGSLFAKPDILSAVPLRYVVRSMSKNRPIARIGDTTKFTTSECSPIPRQEGWVAVNATEFTSFKDITNNQTPGEVWALGDASYMRNLYKYDATLDPPAFVKKMSNVNLVDISLSSNGTLWAISNDQHLMVLPPGATAWQVHPKNPYPVTALESGQDATLYMSGTYSDGQRDLGKIFDDLSKDPVGFLDDAQCIPGTHYSFGVTDQGAFYLNGWAGRGMLLCGSPDGCGRCYGDLPVIGTGLQQISAVSGSEIWAVDSGNHIVEYDGTQKKFGEPIAALATPESIRQLEAGTDLSHWMISNADRVYRYVVPKK